MASVLTTYERHELLDPVVAEFPELDFEYAAPPGSIEELIRFGWKGVVRKPDAMLTEGARQAFWPALFKVLFFRSRPRIFCNLVYFQPLSKNPLQRLLQKLKLAVLRKAVDKFIVISTDELHSYHKQLGFGCEQLHFIPYKMNSEQRLATLTVTEGDYIYAGGDSIRDYDTLFEAVRPLSLPVQILTHKVFTEESIPPYVTIVPNENTFEEYFEPCAGARFVVIPLQAEQIRSSGQGTYLAAMFLGKAVIVSDTPGARDLITDGETGLLVPPGDAGALREAIRRLDENPQLRRRLGQAAHHHVAGRYNTTVFQRRLFELLLDDCETEDA